MAYLEPGVYSRTVSTRPLTGAGGPTLLPLIIGAGATELRTVEVLTRGASGFDTLPRHAVNIVSIGYTTKRADFVLDTDYELDTENKTKINWLTGEGAKKPSKDETYVVTYTYAVDEEQYVPSTVNLEQLIAKYGGDIKEDGTTNDLVVAAKIMFETGVSEVIVQQVEVSGSKVTSDDYLKALNKHSQFIEEVWRIIPTDCLDSINSVIDGHVKNCSSYEERKERCAVYSKEGAELLTTSDDVIDAIGGLAESKSNERVSVIYPASATKSLSNGEVRTLGGQHIAAAYAGLEFSQPLYKSKTRSTTGVFSELLGVQLTRREKNKLAEKGVMIFEQPNGPGTNVVCRHQLSTNMDSPEFRENSVLACKDYVAKDLRGVLDTYIGKYNITSDLITKITGSVNAKFVNLVSEGWLIEGALTALYQDEFNPDSLIMEVRIKVPYPCNYIKLTILSE